MNENQEHLQHAHQVAQRFSPDPDTKVGVAVKTVTGDVYYNWNDFPAWVRNTPERLKRPDKYKWLLHAEQNVIAFLANVGCQTNGAVMYLPWFPCADCAKLIINAGFRRLVCYAPDTSNLKWGAEFKIAQEMLDESNVQVVYEERV